MNYFNIFTIISISVFYCSSISAATNPSIELNQKIKQIARYKNFASAKAAINNLLAAGANPDYQDKNGNTVLHKAATRGSISSDKIFQILFQAHANPFITNNKGHTAIDVVHNRYGWRKRRIKQMLADYQQNFHISATASLMVENGRFNTGIFDTIHTMLAPN